MDWYAKLKEDMNNHALRDYPKEAVGVILKDFTYKDFPMYLNRPRNKCLSEAIILRPN